MVGSMNDPRIAEFSARIDEAEENYHKLTELLVRKTGGITLDLKNNIDRMKQQRKDIIEGKV